MSSLPTAKTEKSEIIRDKDTEMINRVMDEESKQFSPNPPAPQGAGIYGRPYVPTQPSPPYGPMQQPYPGSNNEPPSNSLRNPTKESSFETPTQPASIYCQTPHPDVKIPQKVDYYCPPDNTLRCTFCPCVFEGKHYHMPLEELAKDYCQKMSKEIENLKKTKEDEEGEKLRVIKADSLNTRATRLINQLEQTRNQKIQEIDELQGSITRILNEKKEKLEAISDQLKKNIEYFTETLNSYNNEIDSMGGIIQKEVDELTDAIRMMALEDKDIIEGTKIIVNTFYKRKNPEAKNATKPKMAKPNEELLLSYQHSYENIVMQDQEIQQLKNTVESIIQRTGPSNSIAEHPFYLPQGYSSVILYESLKRKGKKILVPDLNVPLYCDAVGSDWSIYVTGGTRDLITPLDETTEIRLKPNTPPSKTSLARLHVPTYQHSSFVLQKSLIVCGGRDDNGNIMANSEILNLMNADREEWKNVSFLKSPRCMASVCANELAGVAYLFGGISTEGFSIPLERFQMSDRTWNAFSLRSSSLPELHSSGIAVFNESGISTGGPEEIDRNTTIFIFGGYTGKNFDEKSEKVFRICDRVVYECTPISYPDTFAGRHPAIFSKGLEIISATGAHIMENNVWRVVPNTDWHPL